MIIVALVVLMVAVSLGLKVRDERKRRSRLKLLQGGAEKSFEGTKETKR